MPRHRPRKRASPTTKDVDEAVKWYTKAVFECDDPISHLASITNTTAKAISSSGRPALVQLPDLGICSVDVPAEVAIAEVDECLARLDGTNIAVAYPSFRHKE